MPRRLFFDTYAMIAIAHKEAAFEPYLDAEPVTTWWNVTEFYFISRRDGVPQATAELIARRYRPCCVEPKDSTYFSAAEFRLRHRFRDSSGKFKRVSYADAVGYQVSLSQGIPFLTGDRGFKSLANVEFVR